jgi:hypothetical protein
MKTRRTKKDNKRLAAALVSDLTSGLPYTFIAVRNRVSVKFVCETAKREGLTRRPRKSQSQTVGQEG